MFFLKGDTQNPLLAKIHSELVKEAEKWSADQLRPVKIEIELPTTIVRRPLEISTEESRTRARTNQAETLRERVQRRLRIFLERNLIEVLIQMKLLL